jgi:hypothetical protein
LDDLPQKFRKFIFDNIERKAFDILDICCVETDTNGEGYVVYFVGNGMIGTSYCILDENNSIVRDFTFNIIPFSDITVFKTLLKKYLENDEFNF